MSDWRDSAACAGKDPRLWFATPTVDPIAAAVAVRVCRACPVQRECAGEALRLVHVDGQLYGTWAGVVMSGAGSVARLASLAVSWSR
jgi:WhiB family redox-sensing transcriptional regulator